MRINKLPAKQVDDGAAITSNPQPSKQKESKGDEVDDQVDSPLVSHL